MSKVTQILLFIIILDIILGINGVGTTSGYIADIIKNPYNIQSSGLVLEIIAAIGAVFVASVTISLVFKSDLAVTAPMTFVILAFNAEIIVLINALNSIYPYLGLIIGVPILIMYNIYAYEWWRTPLS